MTNLCSPDCHTFVIFFLKQIFCFVLCCNIVKGPSSLVLYVSTRKLSFNLLLFLKGFRMRNRSTKLNSQMQQIFLESLVFVTNSQQVLMTQVHEMWPLAPGIHSLLEERSGERGEFSNGIPDSNADQNKWLGLGDREWALRGGFELKYTYNLC